MRQLPQQERVAGPNRLGLILRSVTLEPQRFPQNPPDRLGPRGLRIGLLSDPSVQRLLDIRVEPEANLGSNSGTRTAALVFLTLSYCARPRLMVPRTSH
jgi:hypothetical protein